MSSRPDKDAPVHKEHDVLVVGSGPIGATYAKKLVENGISVLMVEAGAQESPIPGEHKKNAVQYQKDIDAFVHVIHGSLTTTSIPTDIEATPTLNPICWTTNKQMFNGQNPRQDQFKNLDANAVARNVGGMSTHWTCATPRQLKGLERSNIYDDAEWDRLYKEAEERLHTTTTLHTEPSSHRSIRQALVLKVLEDAYKDEGRKILPLPLAAKRHEENNNLIVWSSSATIFGNITKTPNQQGSSLFELWPERVCEKLVRDESGNIIGAYIKNLKASGDKAYTLVQAQKYVICAGSVLTPQLLHASSFRGDYGTKEARFTKYSLPALGRYLTEQTMCFCQVILKQEWIEAVETDRWNKGWKVDVEKHHNDFPKDPLPFPFEDLDPQVTFPVTEKHPWHTQIHRDAFSYGAAPEGIDKRTIVDLRFFGMNKPNRDNYVKFENDITDAYGMPQPTFNFCLSLEDKEAAHRMLQDMQTVAAKLGGYIPGSEPQFLLPGLALHVCGTTRIGTAKEGTTEEESCCNKFSQVWDHDNLYLGGLNVIPGANASNPTLTAMAFAIKGAEHIIKSLKKK